MPNAQQLRAARIAHHIAASGDYDADCISLMFQHADDEVKRILADTSEVQSIEKMFRENIEPKGPKLVPASQEQGSDDFEQKTRRSA